MKVYYSETHRLHQPSFEVFDGGERVPHLETPDRMDTILAAFSKTDWAVVESQEDFGLDPILAVHNSDYISFLATAWEEWSDRTPGTDRSVLFPATFTVRHIRRIPNALLGRAGYI